MSADKSPQPLYMDPGEYMKHGQFKESVKYLDPGEYIQPGQYKESSLGSDKDKDKVKTSHNGFTFKQKINGAIAVAVLALLVLIVGMIVFKKYGEKGINVFHVVNGHEIKVLSIVHWQYEADIATKL